jgi:hypothetical protein
MNTNHYDPTESFFSRLLPFWGEPLTVKEITWDLVLKIGVNENGATR